VNPAPHRRARGVTLVELLVALAISGIVLATLFGVVQSQQTAYFQGHLQRAAQSSARQALAYVETRLATAGYGMDAPLALDFRGYGASDAGNPQPCPALAAPCDRDRIDGNDELVFYARNPRYWVPEDRAGTVQPVGNAWRVVNVDLASVQLQLKPNDLIERGRILQLVCKDGGRYLYATVSQTTRATAGLAPGAVETKQIPLYGSLAANPFRRQELAAADACFTGGNARAFFIDRFRFHVRPVNVGGTVGVRPYLVLDSGLDVNGDGWDEGEETIVAEGIESFQVGYVLTGTAAGFPARGTTPGTRITWVPGMPGSTTGNANVTTLVYPGVPDPGEWEYQPTSWYRYAVGPTPAVAAERLTDHQANVRGVRVVLVARGPEPEPSKARVEPLVPILNANALPPWISTTVAYNRARVETTVPVRNMTARAMNDF
jgi:type IV pilus assembly protein PilW